MPFARLYTYVATVIVEVVVTGAGVMVVVDTLVEVFRGMEMKELQNLVAEALRVGLCSMLTTSETTWHVESLRASRPSGLLSMGLQAT